LQRGFPISDRTSRSTDKQNRPWRFARGGLEGQFSLVAGARLGRLWRLAIFDPAFVTQVAAFLSFLLTFRGFAVFVQLLFYETGTFLHFTFDAHGSLPFVCWNNSLERLQFLFRILRCAGIYFEDFAANHARAGAGTPCKWCGIKLK
jgi:hypothetical protein